MGSNLRSSDPELNALPTDIEPTVIDHKNLEVYKLLSNYACVQKRKSSAGPDFFDQPC